MFIMGVKLEEMKEIILKLLEWLIDRNDQVTSDMEHTDAITHRTVKMPENYGKRER